MDENKLQELQNDMEMKELIEKAQSLEDVVEIFKSRGVEVTVNDLEKSLKDEGADELEESQLEDVSGGILLPLLWPRWPRIPGIWPPMKRPWPFGRF